MRKVKNVAIWTGITASAFVLGLILHYGVHSAHAQALWNAYAGSVKTYQISSHVTVSFLDAKAHPPIEGTTYKAQALNGDTIEEYGSLVEVGKPNDGHRVKDLGLRSKGLLVATSPSNMYTMTTGSGVPADLLGIKTASGTGRCEVFAGITDESKEILGFQTFLLHRSATENDPTNGDRVTVTTDDWVAPDLDCESLEQTEVWKHNDVPIQTSIKMATSATKEPPPAIAFDIKPGSLEVPPSVFFPALERGYDQRQEDHYNKQKKQREALPKH